MKESRAIGQWRTAGVAVFSAILLVGCFVYLIHRVTELKEAPDLGDVSRMYASLTDAVVFIVAIVGFKSLGQYLGGGGGIKGAMTALWTSQKPEGSEQPADPKAKDPKP